MCIVGNPVSAGVENKTQPYFLCIIAFLVPAIIRKTPTEFQVFLDKTFWGGIAGNRFELINQSRLIFILIIAEENLPITMTKMILGFMLIGWSNGQSSAAGEKEEKMEWTSGLVFALADQGSQDKMLPVLRTACSGRKRDWKYANTNRKTHLCLFRYKSEQLCSLIELWGEKKLTRFCRKKAGVWTAMSYGPISSRACTVQISNWSVLPNYLLSIGLCDKPGFHPAWCSLRSHRGSGMWACCTWPPRTTAPAPCGPSPPAPLSLSRRRSSAGRGQAHRGPSGSEGQSWTSGGNGSTRA